MSDAIIYISYVKNMFVKQMLFRKAGDKEDGHAHLHDHLTLLTKGKLRVTVNGKDTDFTAPAHIYIKADVIHELTALEDDTIAHCIHALRNEDGSGDIIDPASIPDGVIPAHESIVKD
jgi:quercetin dioxygenase-like cupin family protein